MDSHEKLGNLLSEYLSSKTVPDTVPQDVLTAFHQLGLTEFALRENVDETYRDKADALQKDVQNSGMSRFALDFASQQKKELDEAYERIITWLDTKA